MKLYTYEIDIDSFKTEADEHEMDEYNDEMTGYAEYEESLDGRRVYAESLISLDNARELVRDFCTRFSYAALQIDEEIFYE